MEKWNEMGLTATNIPYWGVGVDVSMRGSGCLCWVEHGTWNMEHDGYMLHIGNTVTTKQDPSLGCQRPHSSFPQKYRVSA